MLQTTTETMHELSAELDSRPLPEIAGVLAKAQSDAARAVERAAPALAVAAAAMAVSIRAEGRLIYVAAGSSGLMAAADALELRGTFGIDPAQVRIAMAGGMPAGSEMPGGVEDDREAGRAALRDATAADAVIAVSASGSTPFTLGAAEEARRLGATVIGIANNHGSALLALADHPVLLATPPEPLAGSTRMGAGTAQKIALNVLSTLMAVDLGHVHDGMMVNLVADNAKLRRRAVGIIAVIARRGEAEAERALAETDGRVKAAVLVARGASLDRAAALLDESQGKLRTALAQL